MATKSLDTDQQISIQALIRSWEGKLTWDLLVTKIESSLAITTTRQTLDKYLNIKNEYKDRKRSLKGQPVSTDNTELLIYLQKDIDLAEKVIQLEAELKVAKDEIGYLQTFIQKIVNIGQSDPNVMAIFQRAMRSIEESK
ncbi:MULTISPECIES: hypothetical protein [Vibrio]|uniref:hypothetical protein n=1 Tax=Vibrio TaxID=662 RepID=UPI0007A99297|nr:MULTISPECIES: hypothetical protein [Vibrio]ELB2802119.1 hypothetical protein [Vibrio alginolyticus]KZC46870.1 hypothetical protein XM68_c12050 [Vibrio alginolyticus]MCR9932599.1 hypothetical protein [Vibrio antiquarius]MDV5033231.1 hypothetical protein [Vibrio diabolicus]TKG05245.1 hypothetical protein FCV76_00825 [Vibrio sp. F13]